jgi:transposase
MAPGKLDSLDADSLKPLVQQLLTRIDELLAQNKALLARVAELEAKLGQPPKTPDNSSLPPSRGQKANAEPPATKPPRKGRPGVARQLAENPDATRRFYAERCRCGAVLDAAGQDLAKDYDHIDIPPIRPVTTRIELFRTTCPCCKARVTARPSISSWPRAAANACRHRFSPARGPRCGCRTGCPRSAGTPRSTSSASRI